MATQSSLVGCLSLGVLLACCGAPPHSSEPPPQAKAPEGTPPADAQRALFERVGLADAWAVTQGDPGVLVGVIDNGFDFFHPDLKGQLVPGYYFPGGYHAEFYENVAHGTLVASLIVARGGKDGAVSGLAPRCRVLTASQGMIEHTMVKLQRQYLREHPRAGLAELQKEFLKHRAELEAFGNAWVRYQVAGAADAVRYLVNGGVRVINISGGLKKSLCRSAEDWKKLEDAFAFASEKEVVIVLAAGNNAARWEDYPGGPESVIVAGATLLDDTRWEAEVSFQGTKLKQGSNYGKRLTVMAPVEKLLVCTPHDPRVYDTKDGPMGPMKVPFRGARQVLPNGATSSAAPVVTALAALVRSARPDLDAKAVVELIRQGCDDLGEKGYDIHTGYGRVNFAKTLWLAVRRGSGQPRAGGPS
jgi:subtilisin family serine protease